MEPGGETVDPFGHSRVALPVDERGTDVEEGWDKKGEDDRKRCVAVKIATFNVNGVNGRLSVLLRWLAEAEPDIVCLQELKAPQDRFPAAALREAGYGAVWHGQKSWNGVAILARGTDPIETRRGLPGEEEDTHSRYIEAAVHGILICCL